MYEIRLTEDAENDLQALDARWRATVIDALKRYLTHQPTAVSKSRIKKLRDLKLPQYRLRVDAIRVYYDVFDDHVIVYGIISKSTSTDWLNEKGQRS